MQTIPLQARIPLDTIPFAAPPWLKSGHAQTLYGATLWRPAQPPPAQKLRIGIAADIKLLCWLNRAGAEPARGCLILVHGLESSSEGPYILSAAVKALGDGIDVLRMNMRSCGGSAHLSATSYHAGLSQDVLAVATYAAETLGYERIVLAGFSLGGHQLLKLAGQLGEAAPAWLKGIFTVSPAMLLAEASAGLLKPANRIYERHFFRQMRKTYRARRRFWPEHTPLEALHRVRTLVDFDEHITAPAFGYRDAADYYAQNSALQWIGDIRLPVRIVHAIDDPIIPPQSHLQAMAIGNPFVSWLLSAEGGHVGFFNHSGLAAQDRDWLWAENRLLEATTAWLQAD